MPAETSLPAWAAIDELARRYAADGDHRTLRQARADAFVDLILGNATVDTTVVVAVPVSGTATGEIGVDTPVGLLDRDALEQLMRSVQTTFRALLVGADAGHARATSPWTYRPGAALVRLVQARDGTCRFPGCTRAAQRCDLDHVIAFPHGQTTAANLATLCRRHRRLKHHAGWTLTMTPTGECTWTTPTGLRFLTQPHDYREFAA